MCQREFPAGVEVCPEHGRTLVEEDAFLERILSRRYRISRCVGRGGMGAVYEARHIHTDQRVAVKILAPQLSRDLKLVARFRREAMASSRLRHENCVQVHDFGEDDDGTFFIAMEYVDGRGIGDELRRSGPMPAERVARVGLQLLGALEAAHAGGILHRDLKPQNIMLAQKVGRPDHVKVVDFGIAKFVESSPEDQVALTVPGTIFGTPEYMSPEQARGEPLDGRSDLYSSAVVLWHMLLGRSPFRGKTVRETLLKVFREDPPRPSQEREEAIPAALERVLLKALQKEPAQRYPDAAAFRAALEPFVTDRPMLARSGPLPGLHSDGTAPETVGLEEPSPVPVSPSTDLLGEAAPDTSPLSDAPSADVPSAEAPTAPLQAAEDEAEPEAAAPELDRPLAPARPRSRSWWLAGVIAAGIAGGLSLGAAAWLLLPPEAGPPEAPAIPPEERLAAALAQATAALEEDDLVNARAAYEDALQADPGSAKAREGLAMTSFRQGDLVTAAAQLEALMQLSPRHERQFASFHALVKRRLAEAGE